MSQIQKQNNQIDELKFGHSMRRFSAENSTMVNSVSSLVPNAIETSDMKTHDGSHIIRDYVPLPSEGFPFSSSSAPIERRALFEQITKDYIKAFIDAKPKIQEKQRLLKACLEERLFGAACLRDYQLQCVNLTLKTELDALSRELEYERQPLRDKIIAQLVEQKNSLIVTKEHEDSESEITEKTNRKRSLSEANESSPSIVDRKNSNDFDLPDEGSTQPNDILPPEQTVSTGNRRLRGRRAHHVSNTAASNNVTDTGERESSYGGTTGTRLAGNGPYSRRRNQHLIGASGCAVTTTLGEAEIYEDLALILKEGSKRNSRNSGGSASNQHSNAVFGKHGSRQRGTSHHHSYYSDNQVGGKSESLGNGSQGDFKNQLNDNSSQEVYILNEVLHLFGISFKKEDSVTVKTPDLSELTGSVSSVGVRDIWIQIEDGARLRITSKQLRSGRYSLTHLGS